MRYYGGEDANGSLGINAPVSVCEDHAERPSFHPRAKILPGRSAEYLLRYNIIWNPHTAGILAAVFFRMFLQELNYEKSVTNEIACLRILSHPGIARLISAFRWRDGAYLVLEYASRGDLHGHIKEHGSLSEESTRSGRCFSAFVGRPFDCVRILRDKFCQNSATPTEK